MHPPFCTQNQAEWENKGLCLPVQEGREKNAPQPTDQPKHCRFGSPISLLNTLKRTLKGAELGKPGSSFCILCMPQFMQFSIWGVVRSACVSHWPSTQEGKHTGSTYPTYFPWMSAKAQCKQAGTNLKFRMTSWHAANKRLKSNFFFEIILKIWLQKLEEKWGLFCSFSSREGKY